jgi:tetratricopeptide (TPR) repeat protein
MRTIRTARLMTKSLQFLIGWIALITWLGFGVCSLILFPSDGHAFETGRAQPARQTLARYRNEDGNLLVFDNDLLDRLFGKDRSAERNSNNSERFPKDIAPPTVFRGTDFSTVLPNRSLLTGITRGTAPRRAAALRLAETGRTLIQNREYQKAIVCLEKSLSLDASPFVYFYLAQAHFHLGNYQPSINFIEVAESRFERQPEWESARMALRSAASAPAVASPAISKRNVGWTLRDY